MTTKTERAKRIKKFRTELLPVLRKRHPKLRVSKVKQKKFRIARRIAKFKKKR